MKRTYRRKKHSMRRAVITVSALTMLVTSIPVGATWAWFSENKASRVSSIQAANFLVTPTITSYAQPALFSLALEEDSSQTESIAPDEEGLYHLTPGTYSITLTCAPDSTASSGYCTIRSASGLSVHTVPITDGLTFDLVVNPVDEEDLTVADQIQISSSWGSYEKNGISLLSLMPEVCIEDGMILNTWGEILEEVPVQEVEPSYEAIFEHDIPRYFQDDYPNNRYGAGSIATDGCGVTALASLATYITGHEYLPDELARWFGGRAENNIQRFELGATTLGLSWSKAENMDKAMEAFDEGKLLVMMMDGFEFDNPFTTSQHFIILRGITTDGRYIVHDPNRSNYSKWELQDGFEKGFTRETLVTGYSGAWIIDTQLPEDFTLYHKEEPVRSDNYPGVELTYEEQELIAKVIWVEAQGECEEGQQAVAEVVLNRYTSGKFGSTIYSVIYNEGQFRSAPYLEDATPWQAQYDALDAALYYEPVLDKDVYYFATEALTSQVFATIGGHVFCKSEPDGSDPVITETVPAETEAAQPEVTEPETAEPEATEPQATEPAESAPVEEAPEEGNVREMPNYYQGDYPDAPYGDGTIADSGSGIVSLAMVAKYMTGYEYTPDQLAAWFPKNGEVNEIDHLDGAGVTLKLPWSRPEALEEAAAAAAEGKILILRLDGSSILPERVHYIVVRGTTEDGKFLINDPWKDNYDREDLADAYENGFTQEELFSNCTNAWVFDPTQIPDDYLPYTG